MDVSQPRSRWLVSIVLVLAIIGFVGFSMIPLINTTIKQSQPSTAATTSPSPNQTPATGENTQLKEQIRGYELVLQREPDNQTALKGLAQARLQLGDLKGSVAPLEKLVASNPNDPQYIFALGKVKQGLGDFSGASTAYKTILAKQPGALPALRGLVGLQLQQNQPQEAISLLEDTLATATKTNQTQPGSVDVGSVRLILGEVYAQQKRYDQAIAVYDQLIEANNQDFRPVLAKALVFREQGKPEQAKPLFDSAVALAPAQYKEQIKQLATTPPAVSTPPTPSKP